MIYKIITDTYNFISTKYENKKYFQNQKFDFENDLQNQGFMMMKIDSIKINQNLFNKSENVNSYLKKFIVQKDSVESLIRSCFIDTNLFHKLTELTGFSFCIDYFIAYETFHIPPEKKNLAIYANNWHSDKPFSKNTIKVIFPLESITDKHGGIQIVNKKNSKKFKENIQEKKVEFFSMKADLDEILIFNPNICYHRAGIPEENFSRKQIMFQLNPSYFWSYRSDIFVKQNHRETKFPLFNYKKKILLKYDN